MNGATILSTLPTVGVGFVSSGRRRATRTVARVSASDGNCMPLSSPATVGDTDAQPGATDRLRSVDQLKHADMPRIPMQHTRVSNLSPEGDSETTPVDAEATPLHVDATSLDGWMTDCRSSSPGFARQATPSDALSHLFDPAATAAPNDHESRELT